MIRLTLDAARFAVREYFRPLVWIWKLLTRRHDDEVRGQEDAGAR